MRPARHDSMITLDGLAAVAVACCGLPLLIAAVTGVGVGGWLLAHGSLIAVPVLATSAGLFWSRSRRSRE